VLDATGMNEDLEARIFANEGTGCGGVIEMDVSEEDSLEVSDSDTVSLELLTKSVESGGGTRIDKSCKTGRAEESRGNGARMAGPEKVNGNRRVHGWSEFNAVRGKKYRKTGKKRARCRSAIGSPGDKEEMLAE
jgi:hypothetical protein